LIGFSEKQAERLEIANTQAALSKLGYDVGKIDGKLGPKTIKAIKTFQKKQTMKVDGKITKELLEQLNLTIERLPPTDPAKSDRTGE
jgi:peptidoglycan hydrolase-like protein with peptidoglycan-binding domain